MIFSSGSVFSDSGRAAHAVPGGVLPDVTEGNRDPAVCSATFYCQISSHTTAHCCLELVYNMI